MLKKLLHRVTASLDSWQRHHAVPAVTYGVLKKFSEDDANRDVVAIGWYGFVAIYPAALAVVTVLDLIGARSLGKTFLTTLHSFPVIGAEFSPARTSLPLHGSVLALVIGLLGLVYGAHGVMLSAQDAMARVWDVPTATRPGFVVRVGRSLLGLAVIGTCYLVNAPLAAIATSGSTARWAEILVIVGMVLVNGLFYWAAFVVLSPASAELGRYVPGALVGSVGFTLLITVAVGLLQHQLRHSTETYGQFGVVIGLVGILFLLAKLSLYGAELNSVLATHRWPRALPGGVATDVDVELESDDATKSPGRRSASSPAMGRSSPR